MPYSIHYGKKNKQIKKASRKNIFPFLFLMICGLLRLFEPELDAIVRQYLFSDEAAQAFSSFLESDNIYFEVFSVF